MPSTAATPDAYLAALPEDRRAALTKLRDVIREHLPPGFTEVMSYGMPGFAVPHTLYPAGYHCDPQIPLPFLSLASQKNFVALYHMGIYADPELLEWFTSEYPKHVPTRLDMGKSCIRFKKMDQIPYDLVGQLAARMTPEAWIKRYENQLKR